MGKSIDSFVISIAAAAVMYALFIGATGSIMAATIMTFISMCMLRKLAGRIPHSDRRGRMLRARAAVETVSLMDNKAAESLLEMLLESEYPGRISGMNVRYMLRHVSEKISAGDIAGVYRAFPRSPDTVIISTATADSQARLLAARLYNPEIRIIDGAALEKLFTKHPSLIPDGGTIFKKPCTDSRMRRMFSAASRAKAGKCAATGVFMCILYFMSGTFVYLIGGCGLLLIAGISVRARFADRYAAYP